MSTLIALTREVSPGIADCELTHLRRAAIDVALAIEQHRKYERGLGELGCRVRRVASAPELPDSVFIEDTAIVLDELAIVARPGAESRRPETLAVAEALRGCGRPVAVLEPPGTLDGGDVLRVGRALYVGLSGRTDRAGAAQLERLAAPLGYRVRCVEVRGCLHLKSAVTQVAEDAVVIQPRWVDPEAFGALERIEVHPDEPFAANALRVGGSVIFSAAFPRTRERLEERAIRTHAVDVSELAKAEGGVTCCSLIFQARDPESGS